MQIKKFQVCPRYRIFKKTKILHNVDGFIQSPSQQWHLAMNKETNKVENHYLFLWVLVIQIFNSTVTFTGLHIDPLCLGIKHLELDPSFIMWCTK